MTFEQAKKYGVLWNKVARLNHWKASDQERRRAVTAEALRDSKYEGQNRASALDQDGLSILFRHLEHLAGGDDTNLKTAIPAVPEIAVDENQRRQRIHLIRELNYSDFYIQKVAEAACHEAEVDEWIELPVEPLTKLLMTIKTRAKNRATRADREEPVTAGDVPDDNIPF